MRKHLDNKGSALVTVIIAMGIIGMLAVVGLWASLINYQMKITDSKVKDNFYSAELVLDQICAGLQVKVSDAYSKAYTNVMQKYSSLTEDKRNTEFENEYVNNLCASLKSNLGDRNYSMDILKGFVENDLVDDSAAPYAIITSMTAPEGSNDGLMSTYDTGIVLKGIRVQFIDDEGFTSEIQTDISLAIPEMKFVTAEDMPDTFSYSIIGNKGIELTGAHKQVNLSGSVYAGSPYAVDPSNNEVMSFNLKDNGIKLLLSDSKYLIAEGTFNISDSSDVSIASDNQLWTENIKVGGATKVNLRGSSFVSDDLTLSGDSPKVYLGENGTGRYVGYGNDANNAAASSAIIINGKESTLDMSGLDDLFVAGYSFIQTGSIKNDKLFPPFEDNKNVRMGESISLKGNQIAYLVPGECIGVDNTGKSLYNRNPITYAEYDAITKNNEIIEVDDSIPSGKTGHKLSYYLDNNESINDCINTVFVPTSSGNASDGLVYYYISLSSESAKAYYSDFYNENEEKLNTYGDFFANVISSNDSASRVYTAGKYSLYQSDKLSLLGTESLDVNDEIILLKKTYTALNSTLTTNYSTKMANAYNQPVFDNLINVTNLTALTNGQSGDKRKVKYSTEAGEIISAVIVNDDYTYVSETQEGDGGKLRLIVATGDVNIKADFTGTVICKGKLTVNAPCTIKNEDVDKMKKLLTANISGTEYFLYNVFEDGESYIVSVNGGNAAGAATTSISYSDIITYRNWTKY